MRQKVASTAHAVRILVNTLWPCDHCVSCWPTSAPTSFVQPKMVLECRGLGRSPVDCHCGFRVKMVTPAIEGGPGSAELTSLHMLLL